MKKIIENKTYLLLAIFVLWQFISVGLMSVGVWGASVAVFNFISASALIIGLQPKHAIGTFFLSLPFLVILPNSYIANLPMWRPLAALLFAVVAIKYFLNQPLRLFPAIKNVWTNLFRTWEKLATVFILLAGISLLAAQFPEHGAKQIIFLLNAVIVYIATLLAFNSDTKSEIIGYVKASLIFTVALGFLQYGLSLFFPQYYFWQFWAQLVSSLYYGQPLADVLSYSNSWFSADASSSSLRMFGVLQDTHAFAVVAILSLGFWLSELNIPNNATQLKEVLKNQSKGFWVGLILICFAVVASGTRGAWAAMLIPAFLSLFVFYWYRAKLIALGPLLAYALVVVLFVLSPWINISLNWVRTINLDGSFLDRASSIYDLKESSNVGRLEIWKHSLQFSLANPLGTGYGNFISSTVEVNDSMTYEEAASKKDLKLNLPEKFITAHSLYLHTLVELGFVGLGLFVVIWMVWLKDIWKYLKRFNFEASKNSLLVSNLALAVIWLLAYGLFDVTILNERVLLYLMAILAVLNFSLKPTKQ